ncbi:hypothetical protein MKX33_05805 [Paenibacillus sp. FSL R5-0490]
MNVPRVGVGWLWTVLYVYGELKIASFILSTNLWKISLFIWISGNGIPK